MISLLYLVGAFILYFWARSVINLFRDNTPSLKKLNRWFNSAPFYIKERITNTYRGNYNSANNYEEFNYIADIIWDAMRYSQKLKAYKFSKSIKDTPKPKAPMKNWESYGCE